MAVEIEKLIAETLGKLPPDHPDRKFLEHQAKVFAKFIKPKERSSSIPEQLVASAKAELERFFGKDVVVPEPPPELFKTLEIFTQKRIAGFKPHYLPGHCLQETDRLPGWKVKPEAWFWEKIREGRLSKDSADLREGWYLVDGRGKPDYQNGQQMYRDNYLVLLMKELRKTGKIQKYPFVPDNSRFGASPEEIEQVVLPQLAMMMGLEGTIRNKRYIEFNIFGNMAYPKWGQTDTWEWFADEFGGGDRLPGGSSGNGGLASVHYDWYGNRDVSIGFGPLVEFPSKLR